MVARTLREGFALANTRLHLLLLDLLWKIIWLVVTAALAAAALAWFVAEIGSLSWEGPELAPSNAIMLAALAGELWNRYAGAAFATLGALVVLAILLWMALEAGFRGGMKHFWLFMGSILARTAVMGGLVLGLGILIYQDPQPGSVATAVVVITGAWFMLRIAEILIRRDAVELAGAHMIEVAATLGLLLSIDLVVLAAVAAISVALVLLASTVVEFVLALAVSAVLMMLMTAVHSYLTIVRMSAVDIMRRNVVDV